MTLSRANTELSSRVNQDHAEAEQLRKMATDIRRRINQEGVAILMVEQNARRCLQVVHRGYVLDQGQNAYTGTGRALLSDPNVIELYLGTLAKASGG